MNKYDNVFKYNEMTVNKIDDFIDKDENILWRDKPKKSAFIWSKILTMLPFALLWLLFDGFFLFMLFYNNVFAETGIIFTIVIVIFFLIHLTPFWIWLTNVITASIQHKNIEYAFTTKRIIIRSGIFVDLKNVYYMDIQSVNLHIGLVDRILKVGDIYIRTNTETIALLDIKDPYKVLNMLQKTVNDIKTDMHFPNELRPDTNNGYSTKYETKIEESDKKNGDKHA